MTRQPPTAAPTRSLRLSFRHHESFDPPRKKPIRDNLSAVEVVGECLFIADDEGARIDRLTATGAGRYGGHEPFFLGGVFDRLEATEKDGKTIHDEVDIEGLAADDGWLWVVGSHSLVREKPKAAEHDAETALKLLTDVDPKPNRFLLGRIPFHPAGGTGLVELRAEDGDRKAGSLKMGGNSNPLIKALKKDKHFGRFLDIPAKENGLDIEGLAVRGNRVFLGLRGPVLRGWACILELCVEATKKGRLKLTEPDGDGVPYRKHFMELQGLGIRELAFDGDDLLILAGPTMDLDGPVRLWRWSGGLDSDAPTITPAERLTPVLDLPYGRDCDHAEGIAVVRASDGAKTLLVVYDSPSDKRRTGDSDVFADLFAL